MKKGLLLLSSLLFLLVTAHSQTTFEKTYGDTNTEKGLKIIETFDGGFLITAQRNYGSSWLIYVIKTNFNGNTLWTKEYNLSNYALVSEGIQTSDSGFAFTGGCLSGVFILRINKFGDSLWTRTYPPGGGTALIEDYEHCFM